MKKGIIFNIQKFSINDGPGIRTTVFMKGCPLNCIWCHNPESKSGKKEVFYDERKCSGCRRCGDVCSEGCHFFDAPVHDYDRTKCVVCGKCADVCYNQALENVGEEKTVDEVLSEVMKDKIFYDNSGGGITLSGGEPMYQAEFAYELLKKSKEYGLHTCIETCGFANEENYRKIAEYVDIFLFDYKETDPTLHKEYTGVDNKLILDNLRMLSDMGKSVVLRCPIIPGLNDRSDHFDGIAHIANTYSNITEINIEPYHPLGSGKAKMLGKEYVLSELTFPADDTVKEWIDIIAAKVKIEVKKA